MTAEELDDEFERNLARVLSTPHGRSVIHRIAYHRTLGMLLTDPDVPGDDAGTKKNTGRQSLARSILATAERVSPDLYDLMTVEAHDASRRTAPPHVAADGDASS